MDLLPKSRSEFTSKEYWETFFKKRGSKAFEWYGEYNELCGILHKYIKPAERILVVGCGNSKLSGDLYDVGYKHITNIDISDTVIAQMSSMNSAKRPEMIFEKMDVTQLECEDAVYNVVLDKGTLDALMPDTEVQTMDTVDRMFSEVARALRLGGRYICVTLAQPHILTKLLEHFSSLGWMIRVCRVPDQISDEAKEFHLPVFAMIFTKFKKMANMKQILEVSYFDESVERLESLEVLEKAVQTLQHYGVIRQQLGSKNHVDEHISLDLFSSASRSARYTLHVVDSPSRSHKKFAIFIVPEGRETDWMFSTSEGRKQLCKSAEYQRLVVVTLHRDHQYSQGLDGIKAELSSKVMELAPPGLKQQQVPFLSLGDDINTRNVRYRGNSSMKGEYVVEDVDSGETCLRRLVYLNRPTLAQAEVRLVKGRMKRSAAVTRKPDLWHLTQDYHRQMVAGLALLRNQSESSQNVLLLGLGGGVLSQFLHVHFRNMNLEVIDIDPDLTKITTDFFGFSPSDKLKVISEDYLNHITSLASQGKKKHAVLVDLYSNSQEDVILSPDAVCLQPEFLRAVDAILEPEGVFIVNIVYQSFQMAARDQVLENLKAVFKTVFCQYHVHGLNEVVYAFPGRSSVGASEQLPKEYSARLKTMQDSIKAIHGPAYEKANIKSGSVMNLTKCLDNLKLL